LHRITGLELGVTRDGGELRGTKDDEGLGMSGGGLDLGFANRLVEHDLTVPHSGGKLHSASGCPSPGPR